MSRIWVQLDSPSEGVWIRRWPRDKLRARLHKIMKTKGEALVTLWHDLIFDWKGFYDADHRPIPYSKENLAFCLRVGEGHFRKLEANAFKAVHKAYGTDALNLDNTLTTNWEAIGIPQLQEGAIPSEGNGGGDIAFTYEGGAGAREAIKSELAAYYNDKIKDRINEHVKAWHEGSGALASAKIGAHTDGKPNYEYATSHKDDLHTMLRCCQSEIENMATTGIMCAPFYFKRVFILARKAKMYELEKWACETIIDLCELHDRAHKAAMNESIIAKGMPAYRQAKERLPKIQELIKKTERKEKSSPKAQHEKKPTGKAQKPPSEKLESQCEKHSVPLEKISLQWDSQYRRYLESQEKLVELAVKHYLIKNAMYDLVVPHEGHSLLIMMQAACLPMLREASRHLYEENIHSRTFTVQLQMYKVDRRAVEREILSASDLTVETGIYEIMRDRSIQEWFPGLRYNRRDVFKLYKAIDKDLYAKIVRKIISNPTVYGSGWFDLICVKDGHLSFIEVKTTDTLRDSQITFINDIAKPFGLDVRVVQVKKG